MQRQIIILGGPTASGKSAMAVKVAKQTNAVIINADSQQVYREIPIITAQPSEEERSGIPHRLYGVISIKEMFSVSEWIKKAEKEINNAFEEGKTALLVGGTGMYIKSLVEGIAEVPDINPEIRQEIRKIGDDEGTEAVYKMLIDKDPQIAEKLNPADRQRVLRAYEVIIQTGKSLLYWQQQKTTPSFSSDIIKLYFLLPQRQEIYEKCNARFHQMVENGALEEAKIIADMKVPYSMPAMRGAWFTRINSV